jgi:acetylornithine deacetylase/succinyl-diaminopimelate desuccinylase-like protein
LLRVTEPTLQDIVTSHRWFVWFGIDVLGKAAHGSLPEEGVDAIFLAGYSHTALLGYCKNHTLDPRLGQALLHGGRIPGGEEPSSDPTICTVTIEFRKVHAQSPEFIAVNLEDLLSKIASKVPDYKYNEPRVTFSRPPSSLADDDAFVQCFVSSVSGTLGYAPSPAGRAFRCDAGFLNQAKIRSIAYAPKEESLHAKEQ